jgi:hypothetical protein
LDEVGVAGGNTAAEVFLDIAEHIVHQQYPHIQDLVFLTFPSPFDAAAVVVAAAAVVVDERRHFLHNAEDYEHEQQEIRTTNLIVLELIPLRIHDAAVVN